MAEAGDIRPCDGAAAARDADYCPPVSKGIARNGSPVRRYSNETAAFLVQQGEGIGCLSFRPSPSRVSQMMYGKCVARGRMTQCRACRYKFLGRTRAPVHASIRQSFCSRRRCCLVQQRQRCSTAARMFEMPGLHAQCCRAAALPRW